MSTAKSDKKVVVIGGGTGSFELLSGMKQYFSDITAVVNMIDDGGSTGVLRDELGVLPPGDVRQCLVALSDAPDEMRRLFNFRFAQGTFAGHSFGNIFLSAVERMTESFDEAVGMASGVLNINGRVLPSTVDNSRLCMQTADKTITGQALINKTAIPEKCKPRLWLSPGATITSRADEAIRTADAIVIAPGNLYCSLIPTLLVGGLTESLLVSRAQLIYVANLVNKPNHTQNFAVTDYADELERFIGAERVDTVLYNTDEPIERQMKRYALDGEYPVRIDETTLKKKHYVAIGAPFLQKGAVERNKNDTRLQRSYIRHDGIAIAQQLSAL